MSIEATLERIATALEKIAENGSELGTSLTTLLTSPTLAIGAPATPASEVVIEATDTKPTTRKRATPPADKAPAEKPVEEKKPDEPPVEEKAEEVDPLDDGQAVDPLADDEPAKTYTKEEVRTALKSYQNIEGSAAMMEVLRKHGADSLSNLAEARYAEVMAAVK